MSIENKKFKLLGAMQVFKKGGLDGFKWSLTAVQELDAALKSEGVVVPTGSSAGPLECGRDVGTLEASVGLPQVEAARDSLHFFQW